MLTFHNTGVAQTALLTSLWPFKSPADRIAHCVGASTLAFERYVIGGHVCRQTYVIRMLYTSMVTIQTILPIHSVGLPLTSHCTWLWCLSHCMTPVSSSGSLYAAFRTLGSYWWLSGFSMWEETTRPWLADAAPVQQAYIMKWQHTNCTLSSTSCSNNDSAMEVPMHLWGSSSCLSNPKRNLDWTRHHLILAKLAESHFQTQCLNQMPSLVKETGLASRQLTTHPITERLPGGCRRHMAVHHDRKWCWTINQSVGWYKCKTICTAKITVPRDMVDHKHTTQYRKIFMYL